MNVFLNLNILKNSLTWIKIGSPEDDLEDIEDVLFCRAPVQEPPYFGSTCDEDFVYDYYTHYMRFPNEFWPE